MIFLLSFLCRGDQPLQSRLAALVQHRFAHCIWQRRGLPLKSTCRLLRALALSLSLSLVLAENRVVALAPSIWVPPSQPLHCAARTAPVLVLALFVSSSVYDPGTERGDRYASVLYLLLSPHIRCIRSLRNVPTILRPVSESFR